MQITHVCFVLAFCAVAIERLSFCVGVLCWRFVQLRLNVCTILLALIFNFQLSFVFLWNKLYVGKFLMMLSWKHFAIFCNSIYVLANFHPIFSDDDMNFFQPTFVFTDFCLPVCLQELICHCQIECCHCCSNSCLFALVLCCSRPLLAFC